MNKKLARTLKQRRDKERDQNARRQARESERKKIIDGFKISFCPAPVIDRIAAHCIGEICYFCGKKVFKKDLKAKRFIALQTPQTRRRMEYVLHYKHFFEDDLETAIPEAQENLNTVYQKIRGAELKHILVDENGE